MSINNLTYSDTFKKWFDTTNSVISEINGITVHNILAGDGIGITSSSNIFTISHASNVSGGVTFSGNVNFTGIVSFTNSPVNTSTTVINITPKTTGLTAGNVVRLHSSGLTLAKADSALNSEVLGIVVSETASANIVALSGLIDNTLFNKTIENSLGIGGATLITGEAYFLSAITAGIITQNEPETYGQVSKPVLLGITASAGSLLTYRGILLEGISAGITAELDNKIIIEIDYTGIGQSTGNPVKIGDPVCYYKDSIASEQIIFTNASALKTYGKLNNSTQICVFVPDMSVWTNPKVLREKEFLGLISKIISNAGNKYMLEITLPGGSFTTKISELDTSFYTSADTAFTNSLNLNSFSKLVTATSTTKFLNFIHLNDGFNTVNINLVSSSSNVNNIAGEPSPPAYITSGLTAPTEYYNLIPNGAFTVWQRPAKTGRSSASYTDSYLLQQYQDSFGSPPSTSYMYKYIDPLADRWFIIRDLSTLVYTVGLNKYRGLTLGSQVVRKQFDSNQGQVPGSPLYYIDCKFNYDLSPVPSLNLRPRIENIQPNARLAQNQRVTFSFWAKSDVLGATLDLIYNRYKPSYSNEAGFTADLQGRTNITQSSGGITLGLSWAQYARSFDITATGWTLSNSELGWFGIGFEFPSSTANINLAQAQLQLGNVVSPPLNIIPNEELKRCKKVFQTSFDSGVTYIYQGDTNYRKGSVNRHDPQSPSIGQIVLGWDSTHTTLFKYPVDMDLTPSQNNIQYFCPKTGTREQVYVKNLLKTDSEITTQDSQLLPWQLLLYSASGGLKPRGNGATNFPNLKIANTNTKPITKEYLYFDTAAGQGVLVVFDQIIFDYVIDADITSTEYSSSSFSIPYSSTTIYY